MIFSGSLPNCGKMPFVIVLLTYNLFWNFWEYIKKETNYERSHDLSILGKFVKIIQKCLYEELNNCDAHLSDLICVLNERPESL